MPDWSAQSAARTSGALAVGTAGVTILGATLLATSFTWTNSALSDLGVAGGPTAALFNYGLLATGALAVPFGVWYASAVRTSAGRTAGWTFVAAAICLAGVGAFPSGTPLHVPAAVGFYLLGTYTLAFDATGALLVGQYRRALGWFWVALGHLTLWVAWALLAVVGTLPGLAIPETLGAAAIAAWVLARVRSSSRPGR